MVTEQKTKLSGRINVNVSAVVKAVVCVVIGLIIFLIPAPHGVDPRGMHLLGVFVGTIVALILQPLPTPAVAFIGLALAMLTGAMDTSKEAFAGLGSSSIWLIVSAVFLAEGFMTTGLGRRIALLFISLLGKSSLGISYGLAAADLVIAPATPSNTARLGGILFPIIRSISDVQGSNTKSEESRKRLGAYLSATASNVNVITSVMFITACAAGPVMAGMAEQGGTHIGWGTWALACIVPGLLCLMLIPALVYRIFPPTLKHVPTAKTDAKRDLKEMGPLTQNEWVMLLTFILMIVLWATGSFTGIAAVTVAFLGVSILLCTGILTWKTMVNDKSAWQTLMFFGIMVGMAKPLSSLGVIPWIGERITDLVGGMPWYVTLVVLSIAYVLLHYLFASELAQVVALYTLFVTVTIAAGAPAFVAYLSFACVSGLMGAMTHYASGPAALIYGAGYLKTSEFLRVGITCCAVTVAIFLTVGVGWWKLIGLW